jgi:hypothetical protein
LTSTVESYPKVKKMKAKNKSSPAETEEAVTKSGSFQSLGLKFSR